MILVTGATSHVGRQFSIALQILPVEEGLGRDQSLSVVTGRQFYDLYRSGGSHGCNAPGCRTG